MEGMSMRLINVTNSFRNLVSQQLSGTDARLVKVFSLGQTTVVYTEAPSHIELLFTNERRNIQRAEIAFTLERLLQNGHWRCFANYGSSSGRSDCSQA